MSKQVRLFLPTPVALWTFLILRMQPIYREKGARPGLAAGVIYDKYTCHRERERRSQTQHQWGYLMYRDSRTLQYLQLQTAWRWFVQKEKWQLLIMWSGCSCVWEDGEIRSRNPVSPEITLSLSVWFKTTETSECLMSYTYYCGRRGMVASYTEATGFS